MLREYSLRPGDLDDLTGREIAKLVADRRELLRAGGGDAG